MSPGQCTFGTDLSREQLNAMEAFSALQDGLSCLAGLYADSGQETPPAPSWEAQGGTALARSALPLVHTKGTSEQPTSVPPPPIVGGCGRFSPGQVEERRKQRARLSELEADNGNFAAAGRLTTCETCQVLFDRNGRDVIVGPNGKPRALSAHCDHRLCPSCARRRSARMVAETKPKVVAVMKAKKPALITLTIDDRRGESLASASKRIQSAFKRLRRGKNWKHNVKGGLSAFETTRNEVRGTWHVHIHVVADVHFYAQEELLADWRDALGTTGLKIGGANIQRAKSGEGMEVDDALRECIKYVSKGIDDGMTDESLRELLKWMRGRRLTTCFGSFYGIHVDEEERPETEEEGAEEEWKRLGYAGMNVRTGELKKMHQCEWRSDDKAQAIRWRTLEKIDAGLQ